MINLNNKADREKLEELISNDIDAFCQELYENGHRNHLGASELGEECWRKLWYGFRWVKKEQFDGRMLRLFNVGHSAEPRFISYLRGIGFEVKEFAQELWYSSSLNDYKILEWDADKSGGTGSYDPTTEPYHLEEAKKRGLVLKQFRISGAWGHYGGSLDGMCKAPARYELWEDIVILDEYKTNGTGAAFDKVAKEGVAKAKPRHFAQMSQYGYKNGLRFGLYMIENKNDSSITVKIVELDWNLGAQMEKKAEDIIFSKEPPPRISENPAMQCCKWCHQKGICFDGETPEKNCRSCRNASPVENAEWFCSAHNSNIPADFVKVGCDQWLPI
jgi:hypothetical protein